MMMPEPEPDCVECWVALGGTPGKNCNNGWTNLGNNGRNRECLERQFFARGLRQDCDRPLGSKYHDEKDKEEGKEDHMTSDDSNTHRVPRMVSKASWAHEPFSHNS